MYHRILLPTDGNPETDDAAEHALDLAARYDAALHVLFVVDTDALPLDAHARHLFDTVVREGLRSEEEIAERADELGITPVVSEVSEGSPHQVILEYAEDNDIDLVVMGTHGRRGLDRYLLGSTTERVLRQTDLPVLVVRTGAAPEHG